MKRVIATVAVLAALVLTNPARGAEQFYTGRALYWECGGSSFRSGFGATSERGFGLCAGYIQGVFDAWNWSHEPSFERIRRGCVSMRLPKSRLGCFGTFMDVVMNYLQRLMDEHSDSLDAPAAQLISLAVQQAWSSGHDPRS